MSDIRGVTLGRPLTDAQLSHVTAIRDHWMQVGLSTERCDRPKAERLVKSAYRAAGLDEPPIVVWMDSPLGGVLASAMIRNVSEKGQLGGQLGGQLADQLAGQLGGQLADQLGGQLGGQLADQLAGQLGGQLGGQLADQLGDQLADQLGGQLADQLADQLAGQLAGQLWDQLGGQLADQLADQLWDQVRGQLGRELSSWWDCYWIAYLTAALPFADLEASPQLDALAAASAEVGWWWPMKGAVVLTDRPTVIARDKDGRLHCADGPALAYTDGCSIYAWHGQRVPADLIDGDGWTLDQIVKERNTEIRRCAVERMGWDVFLHKAGAELVAEAPDPGNDPHTIRLYELPAVLEEAYSEPARIALVTNGSVERDGTRHRYGIVVRKSFSDPIAAMADTYGVPTHVYKQLQIRR